jgi:hypothetical protein
VSYLQRGGWTLLEQSITRIDPTNVRLVCTDQFGITHPAAVRQAIAHHVQVHKYSGDGTYHPKVYLSYDHHKRPRSFLVSSANLSHSAFNNSIEAGVFGKDRKILGMLDGWFQNLFNHQSRELSERELVSMEEQWRRAAAARVTAQLRPRLQVAAPAEPAIEPVTVSELDAIEDVFATIQLPIGLLNFDHARNNIRNLAHLREVLSRWDSIRNANTDTASKQRSELKLLGMRTREGLTEVGQRVAQARTDEEEARILCAWIQTTDDAGLQQLNPRLLAFKRVMRQFWRLQPEVTDFFLRNVQNREEKPTLQTIELLCNASDIVQELSLDNFRALTPLIAQVDRLPEFVREAVEEYKDNKGTRGWELPDRRILPLAWREVEVSTPSN